MQLQEALVLGAGLLVLLVQIELLRQREAGRDDQLAVRVLVHQPLQVLSGVLVPFPLDVRLRRPEQRLIRLGGLASRRGPIELVVDGASL